MSTKLKDLMKRKMFWPVFGAVIALVVILIIVLAVTATTSSDTSDTSDTSDISDTSDTSGTSASGVTSPLPYQAQLDPNYKLHWDFNKTHITFETVVHTSGYVGFGISRHGGMFPADVVVGWVEDGHVHLEDMTTTSLRNLESDTKQDWHLISGTQAGGVTSLRFSRKLDTCDVRDDIAILEGTTRVIFSYGPTDARGTTMTGGAPNPCFSWSRRRLNL